MFGRIICLTLFFLCVLAFFLLNTFPSYLFSFLDDEFYKWSSDVLPQTYLETEYEVPLDDFWLFWRCYTYLEDNVPFESDGFFSLKKKYSCRLRKQMTTKMLGCSTGWYIKNPRVYVHIHSFHLCAFYVESDLCYAWVS